MTRNFALARNCFQLLEEEKRIINFYRLLQQKWEELEINGHFFQVAIHLQLIIVSLMIITVQCSYQHNWTIIMRLP